MQTNTEVQQQKSIVHRDSECEMKTVDRKPAFLVQETLNKSETFCVEESLALGDQHDFDQQHCDGETHKRMCQKQENEVNFCRVPYSEKFGRDDCTTFVQPSLDCQELEKLSNEKLHCPRKCDNKQTSCMGRRAEMSVAKLNAGADVACSRTVNISQLGGPSGLPDLECRNLLEAESPSQKLSFFHCPTPGPEAEETTVIPSLVGPKENQMARRRSEVGRTYVRTRIENYEERGVPTPLPQTTCTTVETPIPRVARKESLKQLHTILASLHLQDAKEWYAGSSNFQFPKATDVLGDWKDDPETHITLAMFGLSVKRKQCDSSTSTEPARVCEPEFRAPPHKKVRFSLPTDEFREWDSRVRAQTKPQKLNLLMDDVLPYSMGRESSSSSFRYSMAIPRREVKISCGVDGNYVWTSKKMTSHELFMESMSKPPKRPNSQK
jgi:hypothetical protein